MKPLVSIIVPCYNHERFVESCMRSIIAQTYENIEVIVYDDASTDHSFEIVKKMLPVLEEKAKRVLVRRNPVNRGLCKTLNKMIKETRGEYIKIIASDDFLIPGTIEKMVSHALKRKCMVLFGNAYIINETEQFPDSMSVHHKLLYESTPHSGYGLTPFLARRNYVCAVTLFFSKKCFLKHGCFDEDLCFEDWEYLLRVSQHERIDYIDSPVVYYRVSEGSMSHPNLLDENERRRYARYLRDKKRVFDKYGNVCTTEERSSFYNQMLKYAISMNDTIFFDEIIQEMKANSLSIEKGNKVRIIVYKMGAYKHLKRIRDMLFERQM